MCEFSLECLHNIVVVRKVIRSKRNIRFDLPSYRVCYLLLFYFWKLDEPEKAFFFRERGDDDARAEDLCIIFFPLFENLCELRFVFYLSPLDDVFRNIIFAECFDFNLSVKGKLKIFECPVGYIE